MLSVLSSRLFLISSVAALVIAGLFWLYFEYSQNQIAQLTADLSQAKADIQTQQTTITQMQTMALSQKATIEAMQGQISQAETDRVKLADAIRKLNIGTNAFVNRQGLQKDLNSQLNDLFSGIGGPKLDAKKAP